MEKDNAAPNAAQQASDMLRAVVKDVAEEGGSSVVEEIQLVGRWMQDNGTVLPDGSLIFPQEKDQPEEGSA